MKNRPIIQKWLMYIAMIVVCTAIGGDFGLIAAIVLIYMLQ